MPFRHFFHSEAEVEITRTGRKYTGWVSPESEGILVLEKCSYDDLRYGETVNVHLRSAQVSTQVQSHFIGKEGEFQLFSLPPAFARGPGHQQTRVRQRLLVAHWHDGAVVRPVQVEFIGLEEICFRTPEPVKFGQIMSLGASAFQISVKFQVKVVEVRQETEPQDIFVVLSEIQSMPRVDRHYWRQLIAGEF